MNDIAVDDNCEEFRPSRTFCSATRSPVTYTFAIPDSFPRTLVKSSSSPNSSSNQVTTLLLSLDVDASTLTSRRMYWILSSSMLTVCATRSAQVSPVNGSAVDVFCDKFNKAAPRSNLEVFCLSVYLQSQPYHIFHRI